MANIELLMTNLDSLDKTFNNLAAQIENVMGEVKKTQGKLNNQVEAKMSIDNRFNRIQNLLNKEKTYFENLAKVSDVVYAEFKQLDTQMANVFKGTEQVPTAKSTLQSVITNNYTSKYGNMGGFMLAAGSAWAISELSKWNTKMNALNKNVQTTTTTVKKETAAANTAAKQTTTTTTTTTSTTKITKEYKQKILDDINKRYANLPNSKSGKGFKHRCGALVYQQLKDLGIVKSGESTTYGKDYAKVLMKKGKTAAGYTCTGYTGNDAFDKLLKANKLPLTNIVCSFGKGGNFTSDAGHTMLISRIDEAGNVYFVDNTKASNYKAVCMTMAEFKKFYFKSSNVCTGVTYLHK